MLKTQSPHSKSGLIDAAKKSFGLKTLDEIEDRDIEWVWYPYFARGELTIVEGDPEAKKSFMVQAATRALMDGRPLPSPWPDLQASPGNIVLFDCENSGSTVLKKRYRYLRLQNEQRVFIKEDPFQMNHDDIEGIIAVLRPIRPLVVVFDTLNEYLESKANTNNGRDVVQALQPFKKMAQELNCAVVLIRHLTKDGNRKAMYRGQGSISFNGKARIVISIGAHPEDPDVACMAHTKMQFGKKPQALSYEVRWKGTQEERDRFHFSWGGFEPYSVEDILGGEDRKGPGRPDTARDAARTFLTEALADGPLEFERLERMAEARSISTSTLRRAADELGIVKPRGGKSTWSLP